MIIAAVILLFISLILVHEWGHFMAAKKLGVGVEEFGLGLPPRLWGKKWRGTLYSINLLPLGGFVRMKGEDVAAARGRDTFIGTSFPRKTVILLAGVAMNMVAAVVLFYALCVTGLPGLGAQFEPRFLKSEYAEPKQLILVEVVAGSPADKSGLRRGDYIIGGMEGGKVTDFVSNARLAAFTKKNAGQTVQLFVKQDGKQRVLSVKLRTAGESGALGVIGQESYKLRYDPVTAVPAALYITGALFAGTIAGIVVLLAGVPTLIAGLFSAGVPAEAAAASGPVGIVYMLSNLSSMGMEWAILFAANISVALAAFNVLPLPALDGGRLAVAAVRRFVWPKLSDEAEIRFHTVGFGLLVALMLLITVYDFRKIF